jgi:SanA protein
MKRFFHYLLYKRWIRWAFVGIIMWAITIGVAGFLINQKVIHDTMQYIYSDTRLIPANRVGLMLGTSRYWRSGSINLYFEYRIRAAVELYKAGKIKYIIVSGDNGTRNYNEPEDMKTELMKRGVPDSCIYLDYAGFRTLDSVVRCSEIFSQDSITIISQNFHLERAIYIARVKGIYAVGYKARDVNASVNKYVQLREWFARLKLFSDLYVFNVQPKFLGEKVVIK